MVITEAKQLLENSDLTIKEIATKLNFPTQSFFGKYFKQYVGVSPKEYRNKQISSCLSELTELPPKHPSCNQTGYQIRDRHTDPHAELPVNRGRINRQGISTST